MADQKKHVPKQTIKAYVLMLVGSALVALSFDLFFLSNNIAPGGLTGVATLLHHLTGVQVGIATIALNAPLFLIGYRAVGGSFAFRSLLTMLLLSVLIDLIPEAPLTGDMLLASIFGGVLMGVGLGLVMRAGATTGGTVLAAKIIHTRWAVVSVGGVLFALDCLVVVAAGVVFDVQAALYAMVAILITAKVMDWVLQGLNTAKQLLIISDSAEAIAKRVTADMNRGATLLSATGAYSGEPRGMMLCVVSNTEVARLKEIVAEVDPRAFVTVSNVHEAMGEGFAGLGKK
ncbi:MAG: YitT family protein [Clostridia bacterium]|nr:YitT family protein [Clostridia bacterium]